MTDPVVNPPKVFSNPVHFLAFGFGTGLSPKAPGTVGTLAAIPLYLLIADLPLLAYAGVVLAGFALGVYLCEQTSKDMGVHDHGGIVWDEIIGYWIALFAMPFSWVWIVAAFVAFRLFDIWKPWPIKVLDEKVHGGFGIMIDDVLAGVYALVVLQIALYVVNAA